MRSFPLTPSLKRGLGLVLLVPTLIVGAIAFPTPVQNVKAQVAPGDGRALTVRSDIQEANSQTGVVTARGNVQMYYPSRQIQATAAQAQYFSRERRIVLTGNVYVLQQGNSMRGENITYLIDEGRFVAIPQTNRQVESIYIVSDPEAPTQPVAPRTSAPFNPKPAFKTPVSAPTPAKSNQSSSSINQSEIISPARVPQIPSSANPSEIISPARVPQIPSSVNPNEIIAPAIPPQIPSLNRSITSPLPVKPARSIPTF